MTFGPMQMLIVGFDGNEFKGEILPELRRLGDHDVVRLIDLLLVSKDESGEVTRLEISDLSADESAALGAIAAELIGFEEEAGLPVEDLPNLHEEVWFVADAIPPGTTAAVAILEHRWAIPLRDSIERAGGRALADAWLHPSDLLQIGAFPDASTTSTS